MRRLTIMLILALCSCSVMTEQEPPAPSEMGGIPKVKSSVAVTMSREDSLKQVFKFQTNKDAIMQNYVNFAEGEFRLSISREAAKDLGVSDEIYDKYVEQVRVSNNQITEENAK